MHTVMEYKSSTPKFDIAIVIMSGVYLVCAFVAAWRHDGWAMFTFGMYSIGFFVIGGFSIGRSGRC